MPPDTADYITAQRLPRRIVIIDEYQDISASRQGLVRAMRDQAGFRLFCVGDDWQSIYRFSGSDVGNILNFERHLGKCGAHLG